MPVFDMSWRRRILAAALSFAISGTFVAQAQAQAATGTLSGVVKSQADTPVAGATVSVRGPATASATTADDGSFSLSVVPGLYQVTVNKGGFQPASVADVTVGAGTTQTVTVSLAAVDITTLRTIGTVNATGHGASTINTGAAAQTYVSAQTFNDYANPQINDVLQRIPDVVIQKLGTQKDTSIVVGGLQPYETQVLIDGHPVALGQYGVWLSQYFPSYLIGGAETETGPGNTTPFANIAVAGTVNLTTPGFTTKTVATGTYGYDQYQSQYANVLFSGSYGHLKYVASAGTSGANDYYFKKSECDVYVTDPTGPPPNTSGFGGIVPFCGNFSGSFHNRGLLGKLHYDLSPATSIEAGFIGTYGGYSPQGSAWGESWGPTTVEACIPGTLQCTSPQDAGLIGTTINGFYWFPGTDIQNTQQMYTAQLKTTIGNDTLILRPYLGALQPETYVGQGEGYYPAFYAPNATYAACPPVGTPVTATCYPGPQSLPPGTQIPGAYNNTSLPAPNQFEATACPPGTVFSFNQINSPANTIVTQGGQEECFQYPYSTYEQDKLYGSTFSYIHPFGDSEVTFTYDYHGSSTFAYVNTPANFAVPFSATRFSTFSITGAIALVSHLTLNFGLYNTQWTASGQQPIFDVATNTITGYGALGRSVSRFDPHFALVFHPNPNDAYRVALGSSETFPFVGDISGPAISQPPAFLFSAGSISQKNPNLLPEYAFAYSAGMDHRFGNGSVASLDLSDTNVQNVFQQSTVLETVPYLGSTGVLGIFTPINVAHLNAALATFKYVYAPARGLGYNISATADSSIMGGIPAAVYNGTPGLPANDVQVCGGGAFTPGLATCIPYLKGYGQVTYAWNGGGFAALGVDFEGKNNAYYQMPFAMADLVARQPLTRYLELQLSVQNLFNNNSFNYLPAANAGVPAVGNYTPDGVTIAQGSFSTYLIPAPTRTVRLSVTAHLGN
ncbi:MAG TPA: TonB-dependent receptor [Candidatus Lustribacter sp.]|jgi:outer membrane receptor protein involved in Fe transport|nr:TonB-dependent receptor [Candidatus Lustribacter sp.]